MIKVGHKFPDFSLTANTKLADVDSAFEKITSDVLQGKWTILFSWPFDFTFVCPTEIIAMGDKKDAFDEVNTQVFGMSADSHFVHLAWRRENEKIGAFPYPMLSDYKKDLSTALGILDIESGAPQRTTLIINPKGMVVFVSVTDMSVGRNVDEIERVLQASQSGGLCPVNWKMGEKTL